MSKDRKQRKKAEIPTSETKEERFVRVVTPRVKKTIIQLRLVKQTITGNNYSMNEEQVKLICDSINNELEDIYTAFNSKNKKKEKEAVNFSL